MKQYRCSEGELKMGFIITVGVIVIAISCLTIEVKLRKANEQNKEIIELLKQLNEK
jgi:hypothetical protein